MNCYRRLHTQSQIGWFNTKRSFKLAGNRENESHTGDPYVVVLLNGDIVHKTVVKHNTLDPVFNEHGQVGASNQHLPYTLYTVRPRFFADVGRTRISF